MEAHNKLLQRYQSKLGPVWGLYFFGLNSPYDIKFSLLKLVCNIVLAMIRNNVMFYTMTNITTFNVILTMLLGCVPSLVEYFMFDLLQYEQSQISSYVVDRCDKIMANTSNKWKNENPNQERQRALRDLFRANTYMTQTFMCVLDKIINSVSILITVSFIDVVTSLMIIVTTVILYFVHRAVESELSEMDKTIFNKSRIIQNKLSNRFVNKFNVEINPIFNDESDFVEPIVDNENIWMSRSKLTTRNHTIVNFVRQVCTAVIIIHLINNGKLKLGLFILSNNVFGFEDAIKQIKECTNLSMSLLSQAIEMLKLAKPDVIVQSDSAPNVIKINELTTQIGVTRINIMNKVIDLNKPGIILLSAPKGRGKSLTLRCLGGIHDADVCDIEYDGIKAHPNKFKKFRLFLKQTFAEDLKSNEKNTITMSLKELFPGGSYLQIKKFLKCFAVIPDENKYDSPLSSNENGLSLGSVQAYAIASQIWKAKQYRLKLWMLDEPERCIDFGSIKKIFKQVVLKHKGPILLITHSEELKMFLKDKIIDTWFF